MSSKILNSVIFVTIGAVFALVVGTLRSLVLARLIAPADYGIWTAVQLIVTLAPIACLGTVEALLKQVPYFRGKDDAAGLQKVENSVFATIVLAALLLAVVFLGCAHFLPFQFIHDNLVQVQITAAAACVGFFTLYYYNRCIAYEDFKLVSGLDMLRSTSSSVCILLFAWRWGLLGASLGYLTGELFSWIVIAHICGKRHGNVHVSFNFKLMADAVRVGFPITIIWWVYSIHSSVGRFAATSTASLGPVATGYLGVGGSIAVPLSLIPNMVGRVFYPRINAQIGANAGTEALRRTVVAPTSCIALLQPAAQAVIFFMLPLIYTYCLPKYKPGLACGQILILGVFFIGLIRNGSNYMIAAGLQWRLMSYMAVSVAGNIVGCLVFLKLGLGINGIALSAALASALLGVLIWQRVFLELKYGLRDRVLLHVNLYSPFAGTLLAILLVHFVFQSAGWTSVQSLGPQMLLVLGICGAVVMLVPGTRAQVMDLSRRGSALFNARFKPAAVSLAEVPAERIEP